MTEKKQIPRDLKSNGLSNYSTCLEICQDLDDTKLTAWRLLQLKNGMKSIKPNRETMQPQELIYGPNLQIKIDGDNIEIIWVVIKVYLFVTKELDSERSDECINFTMIITSQNNASISNFGSGFQWKCEYPWCIIEVKMGKWVPFCCTLGGGVDLGLGITYEELCIKFSSILIGPKKFYRHFKKKFSEKLKISVILEGKLMEHLVLYFKFLVINTKTTIRKTHKEPCIQFSSFFGHPTFFYRHLKKKFA
ncbi:hypothetical protein AGLY_008232 [Aphis glycines]|uniref:Uncharacterized protein n=1 Tax=Aphis glycines TaxID=307491 RepID=A0A6G0TNI4_APHGL|nr:hypothetical protein AGLY_008232 [Aphis glycines]